MTSWFSMQMDSSRLPLVLALPVPILSKTFSQVLANSSVKVSKKDDFVCIRVSTKYLVELVIEFFTGLWVIVGIQAATRVQYLLSTKWNFSMINLSFTGLRSSNILVRRPFLTAKATSYSFVCWSFPTPVGLASLLSDAATFRESDLPPSCNVYVVFLELLRYYDAPPFESVGFFQHCSYILNC